VCYSRIAKGERVYYAKHMGMRCERCGSGSAESGPTPKKTAKRPEKFEPAITGEKAARRDADGVHRYEFGSVSEAVKDALDDFAQTASNQEWLRTRMGRALSGHDQWANRYTEARFLSGLANPPQHLLDAVDRMRGKLIDDVVAPTMPRRKVRHGQEYGEEIDVDRYLARDPSPWDLSVREPQARRTVTIGCNLAVNAHVKPDELLYRGAAALALADVLTSRGFNVGIVAFISIRNPTNVVTHGVIRYTLKDPTMPLDLGAVTFAMCEIAWFRIVGAVGGSRHWPGKLHESMGAAVSLPEADRAGLDYLVDADVLGEEKAVEWLKGCLANNETEMTHV
jgi:hypothetical protein